jgi:hypothetical protein
MVEARQQARVKFQLARVAWLSATEMRVRHTYDWRMTMRGMWQEEA